MTLDLSLFENIDFTKTENVLFFFIILVIALIVFFIIVIIIHKIIKGIKRAIIGNNVKRPKFDRKGSDNKFFSPGAEGVIEKIVIPRPVTGRENLMSNFSQGNKVEDGKKDIIKAEKEKAVKKIEEGLAGLKHNIPDEGLQSKMPLRTEDKTEEVRQKEIEIPRAKYSSENDLELTRKTIGEIEERKESVEIPRSSKEASNYDKGGGSDSSVLFQGRHDVPRMKLEHEMRTNPKIWKAARESMLNLTPIERAKLVKETFSSAYGRNISKTDLKQAVQKLDRKMRASKTPKEHEKIRKEIKFFKKIGGI